MLREKHRLRVSENKVLRMLIGPKRDKATAEWRRLHNEEIFDMNSSPNIIRVIKSRIRGARYVAIWGRGEVYTGFCWKDPRERDPLEDLGIDGMIILKWTLKKQDS
jgi:hypothetical protein